MYPTPKEIMTNKPTLLKEEIEYINKWKNKEWKKTQKKIPSQKIFAIRVLLKNLCRIHKKECPFVITCITPATKGTSASYDHKTKTISLYDTSIITALHELGHYFYGSSELEACSYSVHLFISAFPKTFDKLRWKKHLLVKK